MKPRRIQLSRRKGYRKPVGAIVVSRPSKWGNPYKLTGYTFANADGTPAPFDEAAARDMAIRDFKAALFLGGVLSFTVADVRRELRGRSLACWCSLSKKCHGDVLLAIAATEESSQ